MRGQEWMGGSRSRGLLFANEHLAQCVNYLKASGSWLCLLIFRDHESNGIVFLILRFAWTRGQFIIFIKENSCTLLA